MRMNTILSNPCCLYYKVRTQYSFVDIVVTPSLSHGTRDLCYKNKAFPTEMMQKLYELFYSTHSESHRYTHNMLEVPSYTAGNAADKTEAVYLRRSLPPLLILPSSHLCPTENCTQKRTIGYFASRALYKYKTNCDEK